MEGAALALDELGIGYETKIVSAHRTPDRLVQYARTARERGLKAIIAGAGGAAHLPGMMAAMVFPSFPYCSKGCSFQFSSVFSELVPVV